MKTKFHQGSTRTVILVGRWAIKLPSFVSWKLFLSGLLGNIQEREFSKTGWPELCPVLYSIPGGWLVIMARAEPLTEAEFLQLDFETWKGQDEYMVPVEKKCDSFGWYRDRLVAVDYGS